MAKAKKPTAKNTKPGAAKATKASGTDKVEGSATKSASSSTSSASQAAAASSAKTAESKGSAAVTESKTATAAPKAEEVKVESKAATAVKDTAPKDTTPKEPAPKSDPPARPATPAPVASPPPPQERRSVFLPLVFGGLIAGGIGYFAAQNDWFSAPDTTTADQIAANAERLTALESAEIVIPEVDMSAVDAVSAKLDELTQTIADLDDRLTTVEERPAPDGGPSIAEQTAFEEELKALKTSAEEQRAEIAALLENAQSVEQATAAAAQAAQVQAAVSKITAALGSGQPFADTIATLNDSGVDVPAALSDVADEGVVTLTNLQTRFPDTARTALGVARTTGAMEGESGFGGFLKRQLGARSTQPREGSDPDAVLSRVEAAVRDGQLDTALSEIDTLPEDVQTAMQEWLTDARARSAAQIATQDLSQSLPAN